MPSIQQSVFQIYLNSSNQAPPKYLSPAIDTVKQSFSNYDYYLYDLSSLRLFIASQFNSDVLHAFDKLKPFAYKADLGRYCLLYKYGGWYVDLSIKMLHSLTLVPPDVHMIFFNDLGDGLTPNRSLFDVSNSLIYSNHSSPILLDCIMRIVDNCSTEYYGPSIYSPTGPSVFGCSIAQHHHKHKFISGHLMQLTPSHKYKNTSFVLPDGTLFALFKKGWLKNGPTAFGVESGTNNYCDMWHQKDIYNTYS